MCPMGTLGQGVGHIGTLKFLKENVFAKQISSKETIKDSANLRVGVFCLRDDVF